jgi:ABC-type glutathione transport system ATPase component
MTVVFVSHDLALVGALADRTLVMADGAIVAHPPAPAVSADRR